MLHCYILLLLFLIGYLPIWKSVSADTNNNTDNNTNNNTNTDKTFPISAKPIYWPITIYRPIPILYRSYTAKSQLLNKSGELEKNPKTWAVTLFKIGVVIRWIWYTYISIYYIPSILLYRPMDECDGFHQISICPSDGWWWWPSDFLHWWWWPSFLRWWSSCLETIQMITFKREV